MPVGFDVKIAEMDEVIQPREVEHLVALEIGDDLPGLFATQLQCQLTQLSESGEGSQ